MTATEALVPSNPSSYAINRPRLPAPCSRSCSRCVKVKSQVPPRRRLPSLVSTRSTLTVWMVVASSKAYLTHVALASYGMLTVVLPSKPKKNDEPSSKSDKADTVTACTSYVNSPGARSESPLWISVTVTRALYPSSIVKSGWRSAMSPRSLLNVMVHL